MKCKGWLVFLTVLNINYLKNINDKEIVQLLEIKNVISLESFPTITHKYSKMINIFQNLRWKPITPHQITAKRYHGSGYRINGKYIYRYKLSFISINIYKNRNYTDHLTGWHANMQ